MQAQFARNPRRGLWFVVFMAASFFIHGRSKDAVLAGFLGVFALDNLLEAVITLVRTRWYFRVACELVIAGAMAGMALCVIFMEGDWLQLLAMLGLAAIVFSCVWYSGLIEQRRYPKQLLAFRDAATLSGTWGWLLFRDIPQIKKDDGP